MSEIKRFCVLRVKNIKKQGKVSLSRIRFMTVVCVFYICKNKSFRFYFRLKYVFVSKYIINNLTFKVPSPNAIIYNYNVLLSFFLLIFYVFFFTFLLFYNNIGDLKKIVI